ncbi:MAG TPA: YggT family protein [Pseudomonadales bacterium]|nr:YggT family protein [Pseudomonadales bacterium]
MSANLAQATAYLVQMFLGLYVATVLIRFLMQVSRADYYNPISQAIVKVTDPAIKPLRPVLPTVRGVNFATLFVAFVVQLIAIMLVMSLAGGPIFHPLYLAWVLVGLFALILNIYFWALIIMVIASWIAPYSSHPVLVLVHQITDPICAPARRLLPPMGGLDFSIILVFAAIYIIQNFLVVAPLAQRLQVPHGLILGL